MQQPAASSHQAATPHDPWSRIEASLGLQPLALLLAVTDLSEKRDCEQSQEVQATTKITAWLLGPVPQPFKVPATTKKKTTNNFALERLNKRGSKQNMR